MNRTSEWIVDPGDPQSPQSFQTGPIMAWARDSATGEPVYVRELNKSRTGAKCGCECPSCDLPLTAVNAAKAQYFKRPHFRHPKGAEKSDCMYLSARLAALQLLREQGVLLLPRRELSAHVIGLSGVKYEAWVALPPERVRIRDFNFQDKVAAVLTLDDGRQLRIRLTGTGSLGTSMDSDGYPIPTILLEVNDLAVASMSPEELRSRITLVPDNLCWLSHWSDQVLQSQALEDARLRADELLDLAPSDTSVLEGVEPKFRRETLLHLEVKRILFEAKEIRVPALQAMASKTADNGKTVERHWERPSELIPLLEVHLEQRLGRVTPDVIAKVAAEHGELMMIEVTVTNQINDGRLVRIRDKNIPALEINLSLSGGLISRRDLQKWVVHGLETKRWLHHPDIQLQTQLLENEVEARVYAIESEEHEAQERRRCVLATPPNEIAQDYLKAVFSYAEYDREEVCDKPARDVIELAKKHVTAEAGKLAIHGYPEAVDMQLIGGRQDIIPRLLSIQLGKGVGYRLDSTLNIMNAIKQLSNNNCSNHTIYLIAEKAYRSAHASVPPKWYSAWVGEIKQSINSGDAIYIRDGKFDRLLSLLFPELAAGLANGYGKRLGRVKRPQSAAKNNSNEAVKAIRELYSDGGYRHHAPRVMFDDILKEADAIRNGESFRKWFQIWSDRYHLRYAVYPIAQVLQAAGFADAVEQWHSWNALVQEIKASGRNSMQIIRNENDGVFMNGVANEPRKAEAVTPATNMYALEKGREKPRS